MTDRVKEVWGDMYPDLMYADGLEDAILGVVKSACGNYHVVYDQKKCIKIFVTRDGMSWEDAQEFFDFNVEGAYVGPSTPFFIELIEDVE